MERKSKRQETKLAAEVKRLLKEKAISQAELARKAGLDATILSRALAGLRQLPLDSMFAIARSLEVPLAEFLRNAGLVDLLSGWVPVEQLQTIQNAHLEAVKKVQAYEAANAAMKQELELGYTKHNSMATELAAAKLRERQSAEKATSARQLEAENENLRNRIQKLDQDIRLAKTVSEKLVAQLTESNRLVQHNFGCSQERDRIIAHLQQQLSKATNEQSAAGWVGALIGAAAVAVVAGAASSSRR